MGQGREMLSPQEAVEAGYFTSTKQAARLRANRCGPPWYQLGPRSVRYERSDLDRYLDTCRVRVVDDLPLRRRLRGIDG